MKVCVLDSKPELPLIDLLGGSSGLFSGEVPMIQFTNRSRSEYFLSPHDWWDIKKDSEYLRYLVSMSRKKRLLLFNRNDFPGRIESSNVVYLQNSIETGSSTKQIAIIPYNVLEPKSHRYRDYGPNPVISFMGYVPKITIGRVVRSIFPSLHIISRNSAVVRRLGLIRIQSSFENSQITSNSFYGGARSQIQGVVSEHRERYIQSMLSSDIVFCPRGDANGSQRLYETLACGRIPLVPDTRIYLPKNVDWNDFVAILIHPTMRKLSEVIQNFWACFDDSKYLFAQQLNLNTYESKLRYTSFMNTMFRAKASEFESNYVY